MLLSMIRLKVVTVAILPEMICRVFTLTQIEQANTRAEADRTEARATLERERAEVDRLRSERTTTRARAEQLATVSDELRTQLLQIQVAQSENQAS